MTAASFASRNNARQLTTPPRLAVSPDTSGAITPPYLSLLKWCVEIQIESVPGERGMVLTLAAAMAPKADPPAPQATPTAD